MDAHRQSENEFYDGPEDVDKGEEGEVKVKTEKEN